MLCITILVFKARKLDRNYGKYRKKGKKPPFTPVQRERESPRPVSRNFWHKTLRVLRRNCHLIHFYDSDNENESYAVKQESAMILHAR